MALRAPLILKEHCFLNQFLESKNEKFIRIFQVELSISKWPLLVEAVTEGKENNLGRKRIFEKYQDGKGYLKYV